MSRKAIVITTNDYESPLQIGDHHLARQFASHGWQVAVISRPLSPFHFLSKDKAPIKRRLKSVSHAGFRYQVNTGNIWSYVPFAFVVPQNRVFFKESWVYSQWHKFIFPDIIGLLAKHGFNQVDVIITRDPLQNYLLDAIPHSQSIFRLADNDRGFSSFNTNYSRMEYETARKVDWIIYPAESMAEYISRLPNSQARRIPNGVDYQHFHHYQTSENILDQLPHPIIIYSGSIESWFDFDLTNRLAADLPNFAFVIIGPLGENRKRFAALPNLHLIGPIPYDILPQFLQKADLAIIPFDLKKNPELINAINPLKLYEYLASGLPVVASKWNEIERIHSPARLCSTYQEFKDAIQDHGCTMDDRNRFKAFAQEHDWSGYYKSICNLLNIPE